MMMIGGRRGEGKNKHGHRSSLVWLCNGLSGSVSFFHLDRGYIFCCILHSLVQYSQSNSFSDHLEISVLDAATFFDVFLASTLE